MIAIKIGILIDGKKFETVINGSVLLHYLPKWLLRRTPKLSATRAPSSSPLPAD